MRMTRFSALAAIALAPAIAAAAGLTREQKLADFRQLAAVYAKNYAPYEWKRDALNFDLLNIGPWLERVERSTDDLEFYDICIDYVAALNDAHDGLFLPSGFVASLGFTVDSYGGRILVDSVNRSLLPSRAYPFGVGDELVALDGIPAEEWIRKLWNYAVAGNPRSTRRIAAAMITQRPQTYIPRAHEVGETASVLIRRREGSEETYTIRWQKQGSPIGSVGPVPSPEALRRAADGASELPSYLLPLAPLYNVRRQRAQVTLGVGARSPVFTARPQGFAQRLGRSAGDVFFSGAFESAGLKIGYLRIPDFAPASQAFALQQFDAEIAYFRENSDGLILDVMRNPGGSACYVQSLLTRVMPDPFRTIGFEIRATASWLAAFANSLELARQQEADPWIIELLEARYRDVETAYRENRGRTGPMSLCSLSLEVEPARDRFGRLAAYDKPLMVLVDEISSSGADMFPAVIQDHGRGLIAGIRTMGAGGSVATYDATTYSEGAASVTISLMTRKWPTDSDGLPSAPYLENIGVRPGLEIDYMTEENLRTGGRPFVESFVAAMVDHIRSRRELR